jgi:hypothetical protein
MSPVFSSKTRRSSRRWFSSAPRGRKTNVATPSFDVWPAEPEEDVVADARVAERKALEPRVAGVVDVHARLRDQDADIARLIVAPQQAAGDEPERPLRDRRPHEQPRLLLADEDAREVAHFARGLLELPDGGLER